MIRVNAGLFRACLPFVGTDVRDAIAGVIVEPHPKSGALLVATDGHRVLVVHDEDAQADHPAMILWRGGKASLKAPAGMRRWLRVSGHAAPKSSTRFSCGSAEIAVTETPAKVAAGGPERLIKEPGGAALADVGRVMWRKVVPERVARVAPAAFSGRYLADFARAGADLGALSWRGRPADAMTVLSPDASGAALIRWPDLDSAFGVLMPMHQPLALDLPEFMAARRPSRRRAA